jgi:hypothetical protein
MSKFICEKLEKYIQDDNQPIRLDEMDLKDFIADIIQSPAGITNAKLPYRDWSALIPYVKYQGYKGDTFKFLVPNRYNGWCVYIKFDSFYDVLNDSTLNANEAARLLLWGSNIRLACFCPSFIFYGFAYILTQYDSSIYPETRFPKIRNPELKGSGCKHCRKVLKTLIFHSSSLAAAIKYERAHGKKPLEVKPNIE